MMYSLNCSILLTDVPLLERPAAAKAAGFDAVEFWWPFATSVPADADVTAFENAILGAGVQLTGLNFNAGDMPGGARGLLSLPTRSSEFRDNIDVVTGIGARLGCGAFNALYGNREDDSTAEQQDAVAYENLSLAAEAVAKIGGIVLLEPVSGTDAYPLKKAAAVLDAINSIEKLSGVNNIKLLADFYHLAVNGDDVKSVIREHAADFGHIQIADAPGRGAPGTGNLPLSDWLNESEARGYSGYIGLEYKATGPDPFAWLPRADRSASAA